MTEREHLNTALEDLAAREDGPPLLAAELAARLQEGRQDEVARFINTCPVQNLHALRHLDHEQLPWAQDDVLWQRMALLMAPRLVQPKAGDGIPARSPALSAAFQEMARTLRTCMEQQVADARETAAFILTALYRCFWHPQMSRAEILALLEQAHEIHVQGRCSEYTHPGWNELLGALGDEDLLQLASRGGKLYSDIKNLYRLRHEKEPLPQRWAPWYDFVRQHPDVYDQNPIHDDPGLLILRIELGGPALKPGDLAYLLLNYCRYTDEAYFRQMFHRAVERVPDALLEQIRTRPYSCFEPRVAAAIWEGQYPELLPGLLTRILGRYSVIPYMDTVRALLRAQPEAIHEPTPAKACEILAQLSREELEPLLPHLTSLISDSSSKVLRETLSKALQAFTPAEIAATGWPELKGKNPQLVCRDILLNHPDPAVAPLLLTLLKNKPDLASESQIEARLQELNVAVPGAADTAGLSGLPLLEARVTRFKRFASAIKPFDTPETLALFAPLSEHAARILLHLAATAEDELPPLAVQLMAEIPAEQLARLCPTLVRQWVDAEGDPKQRWVLKLVQGNADDRVVDLLVAAINAWGKVKKARAVVAVEQLGALDTLYALSQVQALSTSRKLKDIVIGATHTALQAAAARREISVAELTDELTPDFGLGGEGLVLSVGPNSYRIELQGDLSLRVINDKGKAGKSIPATKDPALQGEHETAAAQLKTISTGLKTVVKQQGPRLGTALATGKRWPVARWQRLFLQHPLLRIVGRSLIWQLLAEDDSPLASFRISEDFSLVDVEDDPVELPAAGQVRLWHPAEADEDQREAWKTYLEDYELKPLVAQVDAPAMLPDPAQVQDGKLLPATPIQITQGNLATLLGKWNYRSGPVEDGPGIYEHRLDLVDAQLRIVLQHGQFMPYMDLDNRVDIQHWEAFDLSTRDERNAYPRIPADALPRPLQATLLAQIQAIAGRQTSGKAA